MRFASRFLIPAFFGLSSALTESSVYIFQGECSHKKVAPVLSLEQGRLIFAHRLGLSKNYGLADVSESTLSYINQFGKTQFSLFEPSDDVIAELVLIVEGLPKTAKPLFTARPSSKPDFYVSKFHGSISPKLLAAEYLKLMGKDKSDDTLKTLVSANEVHQPQSFKIIYLNFHNDTDVLDQLIDAQSKILSLAKQRKMNTALFLIPEVNLTAANKMSSSEQNEKILASRKATEEPMISHSSVLSSPLKQVYASSPSNKTFKGPLQLCYKSLDSCIRSTRNCSGHGECSPKDKDSNEKSACFACTCRATNETITWAKGTKKGWTINYWGGSACHKQDISSSFWLITIFTIVITGVVAWGITMLYSIGDEKLPGVIGAGVSNSKTRGS